MWKCHNVEVSVAVNLWHSVLKWTRVHDDITACLKQTIPLPEVEKLILPTV